ncbi:uncharacterized protein LOC106659855 [Trichogramma pretiosum]|uniref:uncharacterized protein LOC106659855 n=1 Tax=Trichogramma pretiosum TaxID=7493 RepID=UPI0006C9BC1D|nr:uncharacterized protein LOC106659855 [Trichogramma pretiosum]
MAAGGFTKTDDPFPIDDDVSFTVISMMKCDRPLPREASERDILVQRVAMIALVELYLANPFKDKMKDLFQAMGWELFLRYRQLDHVPVLGAGTFIHRTTRCPADINKRRLHDFDAKTIRTCTFDVMGLEYRIEYKTDVHFYSDRDSRIADAFFTQYGEKCRTALRPIDVFKTVFNQLAEAGAKLKGRKDEDIAKLLEIYENKFPYLYM